MGAWIGLWRVGQGSKLDPLVGDVSVRNDVVGLTGHGASLLVGGSWANWLRALFESVWFLRNSKNFTRLPVTSNLWMHTWSIKCR
jgi:hypothetical protein